MELSCEKTLLLTAILNVTRAVPPRSTVAALEGILFQAEGDRLTLSGYNLEVGIRESIEAQVVSPGSIVIAARLLGEIVRRLPDANVEIKMLDNMVVSINCGMAEYEITACLHGDTFPTMPFVEEEEESAEIPSDALKEMIRGTIFAVAENDTKKIHMGSKFVWVGDTLTVVSIDGYRLALRRNKFQGKLPSGDFVVSGSALREVERLLPEGDDSARLVLGNKHICFEIGNVRLTTRLMEGDFINYEATIPAEMPILATVRTKDFESSIERVSLLINEKIKNPIRLKVQKDRINMACMTALGAARDMCQAEVEGLPDEENGMEIGFNHRYLLEALRTLPGEQCKIKFANPLSPCVIIPPEGEDFLYMVLPVRLRAE